jgi:hypothetical protein
MDCRGASLLAFHVIYCSVSSCAQGFNDVTMREQIEDPKCDFEKILTFQANMLSNIV